MIRARLPIEAGYPNGQELAGQVHGRTCRSAFLGRSMSTVVQLNVPSPHSEVRIFKKFFGEEFTAGTISEQQSGVCSSRVMPTLSLGGHLPPASYHTFKSSTFVLSPPLGR